MTQIPYLKKENGVHTLMVDEKPFIALGGEIHNSSSSNLEYMEQQVWPHLRGLHLNTVIIPVFWELIEPVQGEFDFTLVEGIIKQARSEGVRLVLLWFGLWKNGRSTYVPGWMKRDYRTYFRACYAGQLPSDTISPLCEAAVSADASAFQNLMGFLSDMDGEQHTVIMIQIENEIGLLNSDRDYSDLANEQFVKTVPAKIAESTGKSGTWAELFGPDAGEYFMAYSYASAVERIASAGAKVYPLPMFVNAWLEQHPWRAGTYPSGGPIAKVMKIWKAAAPTLCLYAPDIYMPNFAEVCAEYTADGNPLFIPEARRDIVSATNVFYAIGQHDALCFAPFGIEAFLAPVDPSQDTIFDPNVLSALNIDMSAFHLNGTGPYLAESYKLLGSMLGIIQKHRGTGRMKGFLQYQNTGCMLSFSKYDLKLSYNPLVQGKPVSGGLVIELSEDEFIVAGIGFAVEVLPKCGERAKVGYIRIEEGIFENDQWIRGRVLNGDESAYRIGVKRRASALFIEAYQYE